MLAPRPSRSVPRILASSTLAFTLVGGCAYKQTLERGADKLVRYMVVDSSASDPAIDETIWKLRGIPEASARLRRLAAAQ